MEAAVAIGLASAGFVFFLSWLPFMTLLPPEKCDGIFFGLDLFIMFQRYMKFQLSISGLERVLLY
jgi:hypothetical protein